jgi:hypothetical protein
MLKPTHWIYAEYERKIRFELDDGAKVIKRLPSNPGGKPFINVYWYESDDAGGPYLRLLDKGGEYLLDLEKKATKVIIRYESPKGSGKILSFAGPIEDKGRRSVGTYEDGVRARVDGKPAERLEGQLAEQPGRYIGRLNSRLPELRFISHRQSAERTIDRRFPERHPLPWLQKGRTSGAQDPNQSQ